MINRCNCCCILSLWTETFSGLFSYIGL